MAKKYFPVNYQPKHDFTSTLKFIDNFNELLKKALTDKFNGIQITSPLVYRVKEPINPENFAYRKIMFDNCNSKEIYTLDGDVINFFRQKNNLIDQQPNYSLFSFSSVFYRDSKLTNTNSLLKNVVYLFVNDKQLLSFDAALKKITDLLLSIINQIIIDDSLSDYKLKTKKITSYSTKTLKEVLPKIKTKNNNFDYVSNYLSNNIPTLITNVASISINELDEFSFNNLTINLKNASFNIFYKNINEKLRIFKIVQVNSDVSVDSNQYLIQIDLSNLYMYLLDKIHIAEVTPSVWTDDFFNFLKENNIKIM